MDGHQSCANCHPAQVFRRQWSWWAIDAAEGRDTDMYESVQLRSMGQLKELEKRLLDDPQKHIRDLPPAGLRNTQMQYLFNYMPDSERKLLGLVD